MDIPITTDSFEKLQGYMKSLNIPQYLIEKLTTIEQVEECLWFNKPYLLSLNIPQRADLAQNIFNIKKQAYAEEVEKPGIDPEYSLKCLLFKLEDHLWNSIDKINRLKKYLAASHIYTLRSGIKAYNEDQKMDTLKIRLFSLIGLYERESLYLANKEIFEEYADFLKENFNLELIPTEA